MKTYEVHSKYLANGLSFLGHPYAINKKEGTYIFIATQTFTEDLIMMTDRKQIRNKQNK